jgi:hypothetical protein
MEFPLALFKFQVCEVLMRRWVSSQEKGRQWCVIKIGQLFYLTKNHERQYCSCCWLFTVPLRSAPPFISSVTFRRHHILQPFMLSCVWWGYLSAVNRCTEVSFTVLSCITVAISNILNIYISWRSAHYYGWYADHPDDVWHENSRYCRKRTREYMKDKMNEMEADMKIKNIRNINEGVH